MIFVVENDCIRNGIRGLFQGEFKTEIRLYGGGIEPDVKRIGRRTGFDHNRVGHGSGAVNRYGRDFGFGCLEFGEASDRIADLSLHASFVAAGSGQHQ